MNHLYQPGHLAERAADLSASLGTWSSRDDSKPQPHVRRAASDAVGTVDGLLAQLHAIRAQLVTEIRLSDDACAARVDALLATRPTQPIAGGAA